MISRPHATLALDHLGGELDIGLAAGAAIIVEQHRLTMRRRFGHPHIARDDGRIDLLAEHAPHVLDHLVRQASALVVHGEHHAVDLELGVEPHPDLLDRAQELGQALEREELALQRHQHGVGSGERVNGQEIERGRAVDENIARGVVGFLCGTHRGEAVAQAIMLAARRRPRARTPSGRWSPARSRAAARGSRTRAWPMVAPPLSTSKVESGR